MTQQPTLIPPSTEESHVVLIILVSQWNGWQPNASVYLRSTHYQQKKLSRAVIMIDLCEAKEHKRNTPWLQEAVV